jgi:hypothetical protein
MSPSTPRPDETTREAERAEAGKAHVADRAANLEEEEKAAEHEASRSLDEATSVAEHEREMAARGADQKGEGRIE